MTSEEWQKVKDIFDIALQLKPNQRENYVNAACGDNLALRDEVETLLESYRPDYIETPAVAEVAEVIVSEEKSHRLSGGERISHYKIIKRLGKGGMGEVYLADDLKLNRQVALKLLSPKLDADKQHFQRFMREAQAASVLNHPNICTIYEINDDGSAPFIAMEYVEGETLAKKIKKRRLTLEEIFDVAIQVAAALKAAHEAKIVHRDIKPDNVMIRPDGLIKVLDFGLAKLTENFPGAKSSDSDISTMPLISTNPGMVLGTVNYMSPEQARGRNVDARTDIFSFGVMLYEMLSGRLPFSGENDVDIIGSILHKEHEPLGQAAGKLPPELGQVIDKTLQKNTEQRYQTIREVLNDLKDLNQRLELKAFSHDSGYRVTGDFRRADTTDDRLPPNITARRSSYAPGSISQMLVSGLTRYPTSSLVITILILMTLAAAGIVLYKIMRPPPTRESFQTMRLSKLTAGGNVEDKEIAISPDGKYVVYAVQEGGQQSLWIRQVETSGNAQILPPADVEFKGLAFSPDGNYIYYAVKEKKGAPEVYMMPALGGNKRMLLENAYGPVSFSPGGRQIAFLSDETALMVAGSDGAAPRMLAAAPEGSRWVIPAWSPDGKTIVNAVFSSADSHYHLFEVSAEHGTIRPVNSPPWISINGLTWLPDGSGLLMSGRDLETKLSQLWLVAYPSGNLRRITNDLSSYQGLSLTADGKTAVSVQQNLLTNIWIAPEAEATAVRKITTEVGRDEGLSGVAWAPDGRIVYTTRITGTQDLWIVNQDGTENRQLTFNLKSNFSPAVSPDGRSIVFVSDRTGNVELWKMNIDGGSPVQLTQSPGIEGDPVISPEGKWVIYQYTDGGNRTNIRKLPFEGGNPVQITNTESGKPAVSPDGNLIACEYGEEQPDAPPKLAIISFDGGQPAKLLELPPVVKSRVFRWSLDGQALIFIDRRDRVYNLWSQPLDGGPAKRLTDFNVDRIYRFDLSPGGKGFALARGNESSDAVLITDFK